MRRRAASRAPALGNLVVLYDDNHISIEGDTNIAFSEDVAARYAAYGWHVQDVADAEDVNALREALKAAQAETGRPLHPDAQHHRLAGAARRTPARPTAARSARTRSRRPRRSWASTRRRFLVPDEVLAHAREVVDRGRRRTRSGNAVRGWRKANPDGAALLDRLSQHGCPTAGRSASVVPGRPEGHGHPQGLRQGAFRLAACCPSSGAARPTSPAATSPRMKVALSFEADTARRRGPYGRTLHFGIREHAMGSALNGIALHGGTRPYGGTFLIFSDYMRGAVRLAALMQLPVIYVWTHDSIGLGDDGPTHQPIEHLAALRAIPGLDVVRRPTPTRRSSPGARPSSSTTGRSR